MSMETIWHMYEALGTTCPNEVNRIICAILHQAMAETMCLDIVNFVWKNTSSVFNQFSSFSYFRHI